MGRLTGMRYVGRNCDFLVVGCGIVGLTLALEIKRAFGGRVCVIDKEENVGAHASGRNSGVLHAGIYYRPGTLKAKLCAEGNRLFREYCEEKGIPAVRGKVIVARHERELPVLLELEKRGRANGAQVRLVDEKELAEIEPYARTVGKALYSPNTTVVNPKEVLGWLLEDARALGVEIKFGVRLFNLTEQGEALTSDGRMGYGFLVNAAGAYADRIAHMQGVGVEYTMLPYKGAYLRLRDEAAHLVRANIYPVPDIRFPFLGVHFTRTPHGTVKVGPTAIPALGRESYAGWGNISLAEFRDVVSCNVKKLLSDRNYVLLAAREVGKHIPYLTYREARRMLPALRYAHICRYPLVGIRAQLFDRTRNELVMDFVIREGKNAVHILNAVSPAFTCSLAFARYVVARLSSFLPHAGCSGC